MACSSRACLVLQQWALSFATDASKVNCLFGLLCVKALAWAEAMSSCTRLGMLLCGELEESFQAVFNHPDHLGNAATCQVTLHQGTRTVAESSVDLWKLAADSTWNKMSLQGVFLHGLTGHLRTSLPFDHQPRQPSHSVPYPLTLNLRWEN